MTGEFPSATTPPPPGPCAGRAPFRIDRHGVWHHLGSPIARPAMVRLFATVLRREDDGFWLVTPYERVAVEVEDAPFLAVELEAAEGLLRLRTNTDHWVEVGPDHPLVVRAAADGTPVPHVVLRSGIEAKLTRSVYHQLVELAEPAVVDGALALCVESAGRRFVLGRLDD
jgi:uncharacterized protein